MATTLPTGIILPDSNDNVTRDYERINLQTINDKIIEEENKLVSHLEDNASHVPHLGTTTNISNDYSVTSAIVIDDGDKFSVKFNAVATNTSTLNISSDGTARTLKKPDGSDLKPKAGIYSFIRDGINFQLLGEGGEYGTAIQADVRSTKTVGTENGVVQGTLDLTNLTAGNIKYGITIDGKTGNLKQIVTGDTIAFSASSSKSVAATGTPIKAKEIQLKVGGVIRVSFEIACQAGQTYYGQIYINSVPCGILRSGTQTGFVTYTEDFTITADANIQLYVNGTSGYISLRAFQIKTDSFPILMDT